MTSLQQAGVDALLRQEYPQALEAFTHELAVTHANLAVTKEALGLPGVEEHFRAALSGRPQEHYFAVGFAMWLLRQGRYAEAWPLHESRRFTKKAHLPAIPEHWPEWRGEPLAGRRLAIVGEQGHGDQIMWARLAPLVRAAGGQPMLCGHPSLNRLLGATSTLERSSFDVWCYQQSLPGLLGVTLENLPPPAAMPVTWRGGRGIGVVAAGAPGHSEDARRSLPPQAEQDLLRLGRDLRPEATGARDFYDTAEIIAGLELVITVDTSVAHLAGSMGAPTWILLPEPQPDWRWMTDRTDSPWYPSARLFRQTAPGDWAGVLRNVQEALERRRTDAPASAQPTAG
jgi:hypothetical protein